MGKGRVFRILRKMNPYMIRKGLLYLRHFGLRDFLAKLEERTGPEEVPYGPWYAQYVPDEQTLRRQRQRVFKNPVTISVLVPVYRTPEPYLRAMIDSVLAQTYPHWELCIVNADPSDEAAAKVLAAYGEKDSRIRVQDLESNGGISENTNRALAMARGEFAALLDHDDMLSPCALYQLALRIERVPEADLLYTDEDKIDAAGTEHFTPNLKPDYNPDLLCSNNYICHLLCVRRSLMEQAGGFRKEFDGAQDHDLILRCARLARRIEHIPEILYHWRTHEGSTADNPLSKQYAHEAGARAIADDLRARGLQGEVRLLKDPGFYRVVYKVPGNPKISIIIPNKDEEVTLRACIRSIREKSTYGNYEILVVENNSTGKDIFACYRELAAQGVRVLRWKGPFNYAAINNFAAKKASGDYLLFLNNDTTVITPGWMEEMLGVCARPGTGAVGARLYYPDDTVQHAGIVMGIGGVAGALFTGMKRSHTGYMHRAALLQDLSAVTAACMMMPAELFARMGGFEEKLAVAFNDVDLCLRVRDAGYRVVYDPYAELYHHESKTRGAEDTPEKARRFQQEIEYMRANHLKDLKEGDPFYNKNLSLKTWHCALKSGERMR